MTAYFKIIYEMSFSYIRTLIVIDDRQRGLSGATQRGAAGGRAEDKPHRFIRFARRVVHDRHGEGLRRSVAVGPGERAAFRGVITRRDGTAVGGVVLHRGCADSASYTPHRDHRSARPFVHSIHRVAEAQIGRRTHGNGSGCKP